MSRDGRRTAADLALEVGGVLSVSACLAWFLARRYELAAVSDPVRWFLLGRDFAERFGSTDLAIGFPLLLSGAISVVGPLYGFLLNLPILVLLAAALYGFARRHVAGGPRIAAFGAAVALLLLIACNHDTFVLLASPYRDAPAALWTLLGCTCVLRAHGAARRGALWAAAGGACVALACSTRPTYALVLGPLALYALRAPGRGPLLPRAAAFGAAFLAAALPWLVHNALVSGTPLVPAQAAESFQEGGSLVPGIRLRYFADTFPRTLAELGAHYGAPGLLLIGAGLVSGVLRRQPVVLWLSAPSALGFLLFYGAYHRVVTRYLFAVDLFALPIAGAGAAVLLALTLRAVRGDAARRHLVRAALLLALAAACGVAARGALLPPDGFRLADARRLVAELGSAVPRGALVLSTRPLGEILRCFLAERRIAVLNFAAGRYGLRNPALEARVDELMAAADETFFVGGDDAFRRFVGRRFDLEPRARFDSERFGLQELMRARAFHVDRVAAWSRIESEVRVAASAPGDYLLEVDVGRLWRGPRRSAVVSLAGRMLDTHPLDGPNYYAVTFDEPGEKLVALTSERPVVSRLRAALHPLAAPLTLDLGPFGVVDALGRLSPSFRDEPDAAFPTIEHEGFIDIPTAAPAGSVFVVSATLFVTLGAAETTHALRIDADGVPLHRAELSVPAREGRAAGRSLPLEFVLPGRVAAAPNTRLFWELAPDPGSDPPPRLSVQSLTIRRVPLRDRVVVRVGTPLDEPYVVRGFHEREGAGGARFRWTGASAALRLFARPDPRPGRLVVRTLEGARRAGIPPPAPRFSWNGMPLRGTTRRARRGDLTRVTHVFELPAGAFAETVNELGVRASTWVPLTAGSSRDARRLGVMLESVTLVRPLRRGAAIPDAAGAPRGSVMAASGSRALPGALPSRRDTL